MVGLFVAPLDRGEAEVPQRANDVVSREPVRVGTAAAAESAVSECDAVLVPIALVLEAFRDDRLTLDHAVRGRRGLWQ